MIVDGYKTLFDQDIEGGCNDVECKLLSKGCSQKPIEKITMNSTYPYAVIARTDVIGGYTEEFCVACRGQNGVGSWKYQDNLSFT